MFPPACSGWATGRQDMKAELKAALANITADYADVRVEEIEVTQIVYRGRVLEDVTRSFEVGGCLRVLRNGNWGVSSFNSLEGDLRDLARRTAAQTGLMPSREVGVLGLPGADAEVTISAELDPRRVLLEDKHNLIRSYNDILLREPAIATTTAVYADRHVRGYFYSTEDRFLIQERAYTGVALSASARDGTNIQSYGKSFGKTQGFPSLKDRESEVEDIARIALGLLKAERVAAGTYTVVIDPMLAGVFAHEAFGHLSEADFLHQNEHLRELMKIGTPYGIPELSIVDDGSLPGERGSFAFDDEGVPSSKTYLIRDGRIHAHLHNRQTARQMEENLTGNGRAISYRYTPIVRMTNTYIEPRAASLDRMLSDIKEGLYVVGSRAG